MSTAQSTEEERMEYAASTPEEQIEIALKTALRSVTDSSGKHTAITVANQFNVSSPTIRIRWFRWLREVCPESLLKTDGRYTDLAIALFKSYRNSGLEGGQWYPIAKKVWQEVGEIQEAEIYEVTEVDIVPVAVEGTLVQYDKLLERMRSRHQQGMLQATTLNQEIQEGDAALDQAEIEAAALRGANKAVALYKIERRAQQATMQSLKKQEVTATAGEQD